MNNIAALIEACLRLQLIFLVKVPCFFLFLILHSIELLVIHLDVILIEIVIQSLNKELDQGVRYLSIAAMAAPSFMIQVKELAIEVSREIDIFIALHLDNYFLLNLLLHTHITD